MFAETDVAWQLFQSLNEAQIEKTVVKSQIPDEKDILTRTGKETFLQSFQGIAFKDLTGAQQHNLKRLIGVYLHNLNVPLASVYEDKIQWSKIYFGWWGSKEEGNPIYYRIHGPHFIIEYCSRLGDPNHIHSLFRYLPADFGGINAL